MTGERGGRSARGADAEQMSVGSPGEAVLLFMEALRDSSPEPEPWRERADGALTTLLFHGKLGTLQIERKAPEGIQSALSAPNSSPPAVTV